MSEEKTSKFVKKDEISSLFDFILKEGRKKLHQYPSSSFDPSRLTECPRRIIYRANGCSSENLDTYLSTHHELFAKKKWIEYFESCKSINVLYKNAPLADCHYNISGNIDVVLKIGGCNYVVSIMELNQEDFIKLGKNGAFKRHVVEVMIYIWLMELHDGLLLYENKNNNDYSIFHVKLYEPIVRSIIKKCLDLIENKMQGIIPKRPYDKKESNECLVCEFSKKCWDGKEKNE